MSNKPQSFEVFTDEAASEDTADMESTWRKLKQKRRNKATTMILAFSFMIFFLVFSAGMVYLDSLELGKSYILDDDEQYIHAQSRLPHIKFLADKSVKSDEQIIALKKGTLFPHLCEWLQDNIRANFKVLLIPQQRWGISLFESLIGYQLKKSVGGRLRIYQTKDAYQMMVNYTISIMQKQHNDDRLPIEFINSLQGTAYDLVIVLDGSSDWLGKYKNGDIVVIHQNPFDGEMLKLIFDDHTQLRIGRGLHFQSNYGHYRTANDDDDDQPTISLFPSKNKQSFYPICDTETTIYEGSETVNGSQLESSALIEYFRNRTFGSQNFSYHLPDLLIPAMLTHFLNENQYIFLHPPITNTNLSSIPFIGIQSTKLLSWDKQTDEKSLLHFMDTPSLDTDKYLLPAVVKVSSEKDLTKITTHFPGQQLRQFKLITDACNLPYPPAPFRDKWTGTAFYLLILPPS